METIHLGQSDLESTRLIYGCMRLVGDGAPGSREKGKAAIRAALEAGYNHFDHADIYGEGKCEALFGEVLKEAPSFREQVILTSKCGVIFKDRPAPGDPARYDLSQGHILRIRGRDRSGASGVDTLDMLLLHRPDYLMNPAEVSEVDAQAVRRGKSEPFRREQLHALPRSAPCNPFSPTRSTSTRWKSTSTTPPPWSTAPWTSAWNWG
jgi:predicted oxidoreductase